MAAYLSPIGGAAWQYFTNQGVVLSGGFLYSYFAGTTLAQATWTDTTQATPNSNPIVLNSYGRPPNEIWLAAGANNYKFVLTDSVGNVLGTWDNITGISASNALQSEWVTSNLAPTYVSPTTFTVPGNQTAIFTVYRRIQYGLSSGVAYGSVVSSVFSGTSTLVTVAADTTPLDPSLSYVNYAFINGGTSQSIPSNVVLQGQAINNSVIGNLVPAAGTFTNLTANNVNITGGTITGITGFSVPDYLLFANGVY